MSTQFTRLNSMVTKVTLDEPDIKDFATARNNALKKVQTPWAFFVDTDEHVSSALLSEIKKKIIDSKFDGYMVSRVDTFMGCTLRYGEPGNIQLLRLAKVDAGIWKRPVHEVWSIEGRVGRLQEPLTHHPHQSISDFLKKINRYSEIESHYRYKLSVHSSLFHICVFPIGKFLRNYLWLQGFREGVPGFIMAAMMSFHSFLTWTKLYLLWRTK